MPIAEDLPALIPISIALVILLVSMTALYVNYIQKTEASDLHRNALNIVEDYILPNSGIINESLLDDPNYLKVYSAEFNIRLEVKDLDRSKEWTFGEEDEYPVVVSLPFLIRDSNGVDTYTAVFYSMVKRK